MKLIFAFVLLCLATCLVTAQDYCDPFPKNTVTMESPCYNEMSHVSNEEGILINAVFLPAKWCPSAEDRYVKKIIDRPMGPMDPATSWTFSYTVKWMDSDTFCVLGPADIGTDQNGLSNDPLTDISAYALNQWYTRKFEIAAERNFNFSFTCAYNRNNTASVNPFAIFKDVIWTMDTVQEYAYKPSPCPKCPYESVKGAQCQPAGGEDLYGRDYLTWVYPQTYVAEKLETGVDLDVMGDVKTNEIYLSGYLEIHGCLFPYSSSDNKIKLYIVAGKKAHIAVDRWRCPRPEFEIIPLADYTFPGMSLSQRTDCDYVTYNPEAMTIAGDPPSYFYISEVTCSPLSPIARIIIAVVVPTVVCLIGIAVGVFCAVKKYKERKAKKAGDKKGAKQSTKTKTTQLESPTSSLPTTVAMTDDVSDAAVQH